MIYNILDFGAAANSENVNTESIQKAINECAKNGGGEVVIPSGVFMTGSIELLSNVTLKLENGAVLKGTGRTEDFPTNGFYHNEMHDTTSIIWARDKENIAIKGEGTIDINSPEFYPENYGKGYGVRPYEELTDELREDFIFDKNNDRINQPIFFESCKNISVTGVRIINSTCWTVVFSRSSYIRVSGVTIDNSLVVQNDDGIHFSSCTDAIVSDCNISCADDCIAMTCITARDGMNERITISNCVFRSKSAAVRIGHSTKDVTISNIIIYDSNRGIGIFTGNKTIIKNVTINNVMLTTRIFTASWWGKGEAVMICGAADGSAIENINISNLSGTCQNGIAVYGNNNNVKNVRLSNIDLGVSKCDDFDVFCGCIDMRPYAFENDLKEPFLIYTKDTEEPKLDNVSVYRI